MTTPYTVARSAIANLHDLARLPRPTKAQALANMAALRAKEAGQHRDSLEAAALRNQAARESGCDTCAKGCNCEAGSAGCEHHGCWGSNRSRTARPNANTCPAYVATHARLVAG